LADLRAGRRAVVALSLTRATGSVAIHGGLISLPSRGLAGGRTKAAPTAGITIILRRILSTVVLRHALLCRLPASSRHTRRLGGALITLASLHRIRLLVGEEAGVLAAARDHPSLAVREALICGTGGERHLAADDARRADLGTAGAHHVIEAAALEIVGRDRTNAISVVGISIYV
jgi:hypothetical protein